MLRTRATLSLLATLALATAGVSACGDDEETTSAAGDTAATTTAPPEVTETPDSGSFAEASSALEAAGFAIEPKPDDELTQSAGLKQPITAVAGGVVTKAGASGDLLLFEFETEDDAAAFAEANTDDISQAELLDTIVLVGTTNNPDLLEEATVAVGN